MNALILAVVLSTPWIDDPPAATDCPWIETAPVSTDRETGSHDAGQVGPPKVGRAVIIYPDPACPVVCLQQMITDLESAGIDYEVRERPRWAAPGIVLHWSHDGSNWRTHIWDYSLASFQRAYGVSLPPVAAPLKVSGPPVVSTTRPAVQPDQSPTPLSEVRRVLAILRPQPHETFVDYGCGDARWCIEAARTYGCRAVGVEIDPAQAEIARRAVDAVGLTDRVRIIEGDATVVNVEAQVGVAYLYPDVLARLKPKLLKLNRFASYLHPVDGVAMTQHGDSWVWQKPEVVQHQRAGYVAWYHGQPQQRVAYYGGQAYSGRVCSNPRCSMCAAIARQLGQ